MKPSIIYTRSKNAIGIFLPSPVEVGDSFWPEGTYYTLGYRTEPYKTLTLLLTNENPQCFEIASGNLSFGSYNLLFPGSGVLHFPWDWRLFSFDQGPQQGAFSTYISSAPPQVVLKGILWMAPSCLLWALEGDLHHVAGGSVEFWVRCVEVSYSDWGFCQNLWFLRVFP